VGGGGAWGRWVLYGWTVYRGEACLDVGLGYGWGAGDLSPKPADREHHRDHEGCFRMTQAVWVIWALSLVGLGAAMGEASRTVRS
jgi:hypothetical protein